MLKLRFLALIWAMIDEAAAYTEYNTMCPLPNSTVNFVTSPNTRGTLDIAWTCVATLVICISSILHFNIPPARHSLTPLQLRFHNIWILQPVYVIGTLLAPELVYGISVLEWWDARQQLKRLQRSRLIAESVKKEWTACHMFYANMGGFVVSYPSEAYAELIGGKATDDDHISTLKPVKTAGAQQTPSKHTVVVAGQVAAPATTSSTTSPMASPKSMTPEKPHTVHKAEHGCYHYHLSAEILLWAIEEKIISLQNPISKEEIEDRSKADWLAKSLAILQLTYFAINIIARLVEQLPITGLGIATTAYAVCSFISYVVSWHKPKNCTTTISLATFSSVPKRLQALRWKHYERDPSWKDKIRSGRPVISLGIPMKLHPNIGVGGMTLFAMIFGAVHVAGWNISFPSNVDRWLWRASALATTVVPVPCSIFLFLYLLAPGKIQVQWLEARPMIIRVLIKVTVGILPCIYGLGRLTLIVEMIRLMFYLPPQAYATPNWPEIPHIG